MKYIILAIASVFVLGSAAVAAPNMIFSCGGIEKVGSEVNYEPINFKVVYSDWKEATGYSYQVVEMERASGVDITQLSDLRQAAQKSPDCVEFNEMKRHETQSGSDYYEFSFKYSCDTDGSINFSTLGYCSRQ